MNEVSVSTDLRENQNPRFREHYLSAIVAAFDFLLVALLGVLTSAVYPGWDTQNWQLYLSASLFGALIMVSGFQMSQFYRVENLIPTPRILKKTLQVAFFAFLMLLTLGFAFQMTDEFSRIWLVGWVLSVFSALLLIRLSTGQWIRTLAEKGSLSRNIVIIGTGDQAERLLKKLHDGAFPWINVVGVFHDDENYSGYSIAGFRVMGNIEDLIGFARNHNVDDLVIAMPWASESYMHGLIQRLALLPNHISLSPDLAGLSIGGRYNATYSPDIPMLTVINRPIDGWHSVVKFLEDKILGNIILFLISPIMIVIAIAIKLDSSGPVFFKQKRYGFNNQLIEVYKFRSMYTDQADADAAKLATRNDPRVTPVGRFLRKTSLDELPQFINVVKGDMSIVGPRPHALKASAAGRLYDEIVSDYAKRHRVKPGITGWAQINGWRGETDTEEKILKRVEYDLSYVENWSLAFDLKIILKTLLIGFVGKNAY